MPPKFARAQTLPCPSSVKSETPENVPVPLRDTVLAGDGRG